MGPFLNGARALALLAFGAAADITRAEEPALTEEIFLGEVPYVLSATRLSQSRNESPVAITVIDRTMIEASGAMNVPDLLRLVPGFQIGHVTGTRRVVTYHGMSDDYARRMQVLVDGRSVYSPILGNVYWSDIPLAIDDIDHIEVIRGPNSVTYGANSFASVINIITRAPAQDSGTHVGLAVGNNTDGQTRHGIARHSGGTDGYRFRVTAGYHSDEGFDLPRFPDGQITRHLNYRGDYRVNVRDSLEIQLGFLNGGRERGDETDILDPIRIADLSSDFQQLRLRRNLGPEEELSVQFYRDSRKYEDNYPFSLPAPPIGTLAGVIDLGMETERLDLELQHSLRLNPQTRLVWGAELRRDSVRALNHFSTADTLDSDLYRLFANGEWRFAPDWLANLGLMYEHNDIAGGDLSPRIAANYDVSPGHTLRASYTRAWRTPSMFEQYGDYALCLTAPAPYTGNCLHLLVGTDPLESERVDSLEFGYFGIFREHNLTADVKLYHEDITGLIMAAREDPYLQPLPFGFVSSYNHRDVFRNSGDATLSGIEVQFDWRPVEGTRFVLAHSYAQQSGAFLKQLPDQTAETNASTPQHTSSLLAMQRLPHGFEASLAYYSVSNMQWLGHYGMDDWTQGYSTYDARLAWKFHTDGMRGTVALIGQNLLQGYRDFWHWNTLDQRRFLTMSLEF